MAPKLRSSPKQLADAADYPCLASKQLLSATIQEPCIWRHSPLLPCNNLTIDRKARDAMWAKPNATPKLLDARERGVQGGRRIAASRIDHGASEKHGYSFDSTRHDGCR